MQASLFISLEKPFLLPDYAEAMAHTSPTPGLIYEPCRHYLGVPKVLDFLDISAIDDFAFPLNSSTSWDEGFIGPYSSSSKSNSVSG
jgi:hypothetical protein